MSPSHVQPELVDASRPRPADMLAAASTLVQYALAYGVGVPVFVLYRTGRRLRRRNEPALPPRPP